MAIKKNKLNEVAKDFNMQSKALIELLGKYFDGEKKSQATLEDKEMDVIFDVLTKQHSVESFDDYFAMQKENKEPAPKKETAKKTGLDVSRFCGNMHNIQYYMERKIGYGSNYKQHRQGT